MILIKEDDFMSIVSSVQKDKKEGIVVLGAGGELTDWINGIHSEWKDLEIAPESNEATDSFETFYKTKTLDGRIDLTMIFKDGAELNVGKMAMWRLRFGDVKWMSDFIVNYAGQYGRVMEENET